MNRNPVRNLLLVLAAVALFVPAPAPARPGGGHSFSSGSHSFSGGSHSYSSSSYHGSYSGSSSYSGSGGSGSGELFTFLFVSHPVIGIPLALVIVGLILYSKTRERGAADWSSGSGSSSEPEDLTPRPPPPLRNRLIALRKVGPPGQGPFDPQFSLVLFEDFVYALYAKVQQARAGDLEEVAPWVGEAARPVLQRGGRPAEVGTVIVGSMKYLRVSALLPDSQWLRVTLEFEANYTERTRDGREQAYYVVDRWRLARRTSAKSRPPERATTFDCPNCGAPLSGNRGTICAHCGTNVGQGQFDWMIEAAELVRRDERGPQLTGDVEEVGTDLPTVVSPTARPRLQLLGQRDPQFQWSDFEARVRQAFGVMYDAWSSREWLKARPYLSDNLFQMQSYWVDAYQKAGLTNRLTELQVSKVELAKVVRDPYFDSITVRVHASGFDFTVADATGQVVSGSSKRRREWTEYWTLIRGVGVKKAVTAGQQCPNCGAPLNINMAGTCEYCQARITSGQFDWVLSRIEQDEVYGG